VTAKFIDAVEVPIITAPPVPDTGFVKIYGRGDDSYALFPDGTEKLLTGGTVVVGAGDRDISYEESTLLTDAVFLATTVDDSLQYADAAVFGPFVPAPAIVGMSDAAGVVLDASTNDSLIVSAQATFLLTASAPDTLSMSDETQPFLVRLPDPLLIADPRQPAVIDAINWPNVVESNTNFTNEANLIDEDEVTFTQMTATQVVTGGTAVTTTGEITVSLPDNIVIPSPAVDLVEVYWGWVTTVSGLLAAGSTVDIDISYSLDDGASFILLENVTTTVGTGDNVLAISATFPGLSEIRFRAEGTITSGTNVPRNASQVFGFYYARAEYSLTQTL
jgi:hypothetical protein